MASSPALWGDRLSPECARLAALSLVLQRQSGERSEGRDTHGRGCQSNLIISGPTEETGAVGIKGTESEDLGKTGPDCHFQLLTGKSELRFVLRGSRGQDKDQWVEDEGSRLMRVPSEEALPNCQNQL